MCQGKVLGKGKVLSRILKEEPDFKGSDKGHFRQEVVTSARKQACGLEPAMCTEMRVVQEVYRNHK